LSGPDPRSARSATIAPLRGARSASCLALAGSNPVVPTIRNPNRIWHGFDGSPAADTATRGRKNLPWTRRGHAEQVLLGAAAARLRRTFQARRGLRHD